MNRAGGEKAAAGARGLGDGGTQISADCVRRPVRRQVEGPQGEKIEDGRCLYGVDRVAGEWHVHPYEAPERHEPLSQGLEPKPILRFLACVGELLLKYELL